MSVAIYECSDNFFYKIIHYLLLPTIGALTFFFLSIPSVDLLLAQSIPDFWYRLYTKIFILFIVLFIVDRLMEVWRVSTVICESPADTTLKRFFRRLADD